MGLRVAAIALLVLAAPAFAFDSTKLGQLGSIAIDMEEMQAVLKQAPRLKHEIDDALATAGKKSGDIVCDGMRFPGAWKELAGIRVSPYRCQIADRWLKIQTKVRVTGKRGKVYDKITPEIMAAHSRSKKPIQLGLGQRQRPQSPSVSAKERTPPRAGGLVRKEYRCKGDRRAKLYCAQSASRAWLSSLR